MKKTKSASAPTVGFPPRNVMQIIDCGVSGTKLLFKMYATGKRFIYSADGRSWILNEEMQKYPGGCEIDITGVPTEFFTDQNFEIENVCVSGWDKHKNISTGYSTDRENEVEKV